MILSSPLGKPFESPPSMGDGPQGRSFRGWSQCPSSRVRWIMIGELRCWDVASWSSILLGYSTMVGTHYTGLYPQAYQTYRTASQINTGLYVANPKHAKPTKAMPAMPNCIQMQLIATHVFPPLWLYIADLQRPKTTSEQSVPATLAWMLPCQTN